MTNRIVLSVGLTIFMLTSSAIAHHSGAVYDKDKLAVVTGTVVKLEWINPHIVTRMNVTNDKGEVEQWAVLAGSVRSAHGGGWSANILKPGDVVTASGHPYRDGRPSMEMLQMVRVRPNPGPLPQSSVQKSNYELFLKNQREGKKSTTTATEN